MVVARLVEVLLALGGLAFTLVSDESEPLDVVYLLSWGTVAVLYLLVGFLQVRKQRFADERVAGPPPTGWNAVLVGRRFSFFFMVAASITGLGAATDALNADENGQYGNLIQGLAALVVVCAWLLLQVGYARFYSRFTAWRFPDCPYPGFIDFLYFAITLGVSFATSDVEVQSRTLRWHVMVHSVLSFFYNAVVLAIAVGIITG